MNRAHACDLNGVRTDTLVLDSNDTDNLFYSQNVDNAATTKTDGVPYYLWDLPGKLAFTNRVIDTGCIWKFEWPPTYTD